MPDGQVLEFSNLTKRFGSVSAVAGFSARVEPGMVTGFLGPNGAGKTTTLRTLLGLIGADEGTASIGGLPYRSLRHPLQSVGAVLEASSFHPGRTAAGHLKIYAQAAGLPTTRVEDALGAVGLTDAGGRKVGGFSLGMRQRLGLAYALLGDPGVLVLDEPTNGLDPEGIKWIRGFLRELARQGRTVLISSHLLAEVQQTVDALLVIAHGRLVFQGSLDDLTDPSEYSTLVDAPDRAALTAALAAAGLSFEVLRSGLTVRSADTVRVGEVAARAGVALSSLQRRGPALEEVFLELVDGTRVHASANAGAGAGAGAANAAAGPATIAATEALVVDEDMPEPDRAPEDHDEAVTQPAPDGDADDPDDTDPDPGPDPDPDDDFAESESLAEADLGTHRPWETYVPTEADIAADRFFGSFDAEAIEHAPRAESPTDASAADEASHGGEAPDGDEASDGGER